MCDQYVFSFRRDLPLLIVCELPVLRWRGYRSLVNYLVVNVRHQMDPLGDEAVAGLRIV